MSQSYTRKLTRKPRPDKLQNKNKVIVAVVKNPMATERDIAKSTGMSKTAVHAHLKEIDQNGPRLQVLEEMAKRDLMIVQLGQQLIYNRLMSPHYLKTVKLGELSTVMRDCMLRFGLFSEKIRQLQPDFLGGRDISELSDEELVILARPRESHY